MQAILLAAGMGKRLGKYTSGQTKCMVRVGGKTLLEHAADALRQAGVTRLTIVVGYAAQPLIAFARDKLRDMELTFIENADYADTNNIYSLYLARDVLAQDDTLLLESDLIFEPALLREMIACPEENVVAVAKYEQWMDGTVTLLSPDGHILEFIDRTEFSFAHVEEYFKTVNVYKFSRAFSREKYIPFLNAYIKAYGKNEYYESALKAIAHLSHAELFAYRLGKLRWYEIDDAQDLDIADTMFAPPEERLDRYCRHFGGFWRFPALTDFCYLVNPYFPPREMEEKMQYAFSCLLREYPSGMYVQQINAGRMFSLDERLILVGNGAAELIAALGRVLHGTLALPTPSFNEYVRCFGNCRITRLPTAQTDYQLDLPTLCAAAETHDILAVVNPDNPTGSFLAQAELLTLLEHCKQHGTLLIVDESFVDFADAPVRYTLLQDALLERYPNLVVVKSISKSYGVPGVRLGVCACGDAALLRQLKDAMAIWNINSFGEYFLQIITLYQKDYAAACDAVARQRAALKDALDALDFMHVYPSQANYLMVRLQGVDSRLLAEHLLSAHDLLVKDLSTKDGFGGESYLRLSVRDETDNRKLVDALRDLPLHLLKKQKE